MSLSPGSSVGPYRIVSVIGAGGMGEVYRATDTKLGRDVAIKVLPDSVAGDADRRARFEREAQALAALNHFNIAQVYGFEGTAIVMELLEGETLRDRLKQGAIPTRKVIEYGAQIARGLAAAHERGIVHRDLKPENIFIVSDGHIKILDFGLARQAEAARDVTETVTAHPSTGPGVVLGTVGYMSPEQVRGAQVDARSDVFSLGAVLYEMLSGQKPFRRNSHVETMTAILNDDPPELSSSRADINPTLERIVRHCLEKNRVERFQSARDVAFALESSSGTSTAIAPTSSAGPRRSFERAAWAVVTAALITALAVSLRTPRSTAPPAVPVTRTILTLPQDVIVNDSAPPGTRLALAPDGSRVTFAGRNLRTGETGVFVLPLDGSESRALPGTSQVFSGFWSHDSRSLFMLGAAGLMRQSLDGSAPVVVSQQLRNAATAAGNADGDVLFAGLDVRVLHTKDDVVETVIAQSPDTGFAVPQFLDDGRRFVATRLVGNVAAARDLEIVLGSLGSTTLTSLFHGPDVSQALAANGAVVFGRGTNLFAQRLDGDPPRLVGAPVQLAANVDALVGRGMAFTLSRNGLLAYQTPGARPPLKLTWVDRTGKVLSTVGDEGDYSNIELSPDGRQVLASLTDPDTNTRDIYVTDVARGVRQRITNDPSDERSAVWSPDARRVIYASKGQELYERAADGSGAEHQFLKDGLNKDPYGWSPDGKWVLYRTLRNSSDLWVAPSDGHGPGHAVADSRFSESGANFSPDSKRIVYTSDESGQNDVYVVNLDGTGKIRVSTAGGAFPRWRHDGKEIVYLSNTRMLMSVDVSGGDSPTVSAPRALFQMNALQSPGAVYDISRDGNRFIVASPVQGRIPPSLTIITNWPQLLERKQ